MSARKERHRQWILQLLQRSQHANQLARLFIWRRRNEGEETRKITGIIYAQVFMMQLNSRRRRAEHNVRLWEHIYLYELCLELFIRFSHLYSLRSVGCWMRVSVKELNRSLRSRKAYFHFTSQSWNCRSFGEDSTKKYKNGASAGNAKDWSSANEK